MGRKKETKRTRGGSICLYSVFESLDGLKRQSLVWGDWLVGPTGCMPCGVSQVCQCVGSSIWSGPPSGGSSGGVSEPSVRKVHGLVSWGHPGDGCAPRCVERPIGWRSAAGGARKAVRPVQRSSGQVIASLVRDCGCRVGGTGIPVCSSHRVVWAHPDENDFKSSKFKT